MGQLQPAAPDPRMIGHPERDGRVGIDRSARLRHRPAIDLDFAGEEFTSPWGRLVKGSDGHFYPSGFSSAVRLRRTPDGGWDATTGDGTRYVFAPADIVAGGYAWMLSRVEALTGDRTTFTYERNASGRAFLRLVEWGGRGGDPQYRVEIVTQPIATPIEDYRARDRVI